jgi:hypothetical protein
MRGKEKPKKEHMPTTRFDTATERRSGARAERRKQRRCEPLATRLVVAIIIIIVVIFVRLRVRIHGAERADAVDDERKGAHQLHALGKCQPTCDCFDVVVCCLKEWQCRMR